MNHQPIEEDSLVDSSFAEKCEEMKTRHCRGNLFAISEDAILRNRENFAANCVSQ